MEIIDALEEKTEELVEIIDEKAEAFVDRMEEKLEMEQELKRLVFSRKFKRKVIAIAVVVALAVTGIIAAWVSGSNKAKQEAEQRIAELIATIDQLKEEPIVVNPVAPEIVLDEIYKEIVNIGELATVEYLFTDAAIFTDSKQLGNWDIPFTEKSFTLKWDGSIKAGVDLERITIEVDEEKKIITVSLPNAEILSYEIDSESVEILDEKDNIFNKITIDDKIKFDAATEKAMKERAVDNGLLEKAQKNAEDVLGRLLFANEAIGNTYAIVFNVIK